MASPLGASTLTYARQAVGYEPTVFIEVRLKSSEGLYLPSQALTLTLTAGAQKVTGTGFTSAIEGGMLGGTLLSGGYAASGTYIEKVVSSTVAMLSKKALAAGSGITGTVSAGRIVRFSSRPCVDVNGARWQPSLLRCDPIREASEWLSPGPDLSSSSFQLPLTKLGYQPANETLIHALRSNQWEGSVVLIYVWDPATLGTTITDPPHLTGRINKVSVDPGSQTATFDIIQRREWNKRMPPRTINPTTWPAAPDLNMGAPEPWLLGDFRAPGMRAPWTSNYGTDKTNHIDCGATGLMVPGLLVDPGTGPTKPRILFAGHALTLPFGNMYHYADLGGRPCRIDPAGITATNGPQYYIDIADENLVAFCPIPPVDVRSATGTKLSTALTPRNALNIQDETTFATIQPGSNVNLVLVIPNLSSLGQLISLEIVIGYDSTLAGGTGVRAYLWGQGTSTASNVLTFGTSATPTSGRGAITGTWADPNWNFAGTTQAIDLVVDCSGSTSGLARIYFVALCAKFRIQQSIVVPEKPGQKASAGHDIQGRKPSGKTGRQVIFNKKNYIAGAPAVYELQGAFYANLVGLSDDGAGTCTGFAGQLIERHPDLAQAVLAIIAGQPSGDINRATNSFGSFVDARALLRTREGSEYTGNLSLADDAYAMDVLRLLADESLSLVYIDRFSDNFFWVPWKRDPARSYDRLISKDDLLSLRLDESSETDVAQAVRVRYGLDYYRGETRWEALVNEGASGMGFVPNALRDQAVSIATGVNDKFDFTNSGGTQSSVTLDDGFYSAHGAAIEWQRKVNAVVSGVRCGYGFSVVAGFNDKIDFSLGGTTYAATLNPGRYSYDGIGSEAQRAMRAAASTTVITVTYSRVSNAFNFQSSGGTLVLKTFTGANFATAAFAMFAFSRTADPAGGSSVVSGACLHEDRFWIHYNYTPAGNRWATGANAGTNIGTAFGFLLTADDSGATFYSADNVRGDRTLQAQARIRRYGPKQEKGVSSRTLRTFNVAGDLRDRLFDFKGTRLIAAFSTYRCPDMQRGRVIEFASDMDGLMAYPKGDGSWVGKRFWVVEVTENLGPVFHQEIVAVEA